MVVETLAQEPVALQEKINSYDQVPYQSRPFAQSHPDRLALMAKFFGLKPKPITRCKVLELGCAAGGNLVPMACQLPDSEFLGLDLSAAQVAEGQSVIKDLGLKNVQIRHLDIMDVTGDLGTFDYIIAHGLYSWVSEAEQKKILQICEENLAPQGVAYVSYNTYPGWHMRGMMRDMMLYHSQHWLEPMDKVGQAKALIDFLAQSIPDDSPAYGIKSYQMILKEEKQLFLQHPDSYVLHDHLEQTNKPLYFHQFVERAASHQLQYLAESEFNTMLLSNFSKQVEETLRRVTNDVVQTEQYMDFVRNRTFRQTLLCRKDLPLNRIVPPQCVTELYIASKAKPVSDKMDIRSTQPDVFELNGATLMTANSLTKAAFQHLGQIYPRSIAFNDLLKVAVSLVAPLKAKTKGKDNNPSDADGQTLAGDILQAYAINLAELRTQKDSFITEISKRPQVSALVRFQAKLGEVVTNQLHQSTNMDLFSRHLVELLDGKRDQAAILDELCKLVKDDMLTVYEDGQQLKETRSIREFLRKQLEARLPELSAAALLIA